MIFEKLWEFSDHQIGVSGTTAIATNIIDWTSSIYDEWLNTEVPLWLVVTANTVSGGTSVQVLVYQHSTTTITSGDLLFSGPTVVTANASANARNDGHYILPPIPMMTLLCSAAMMGGRDEYMGIVYSCTGNCAGWYFDAYILATSQPPVPTTMVTTSNI